MTAGLSLVALRCRTADRTPRAMRGVDTLAPLVEARLGTEARSIGSPAEPRSVAWEEELRESRGCLLEAGGQVDDALDAGRRPVLLAGNCAIGITTLPSALRHGRGIKVLWLDAHGDYNTPATSASGYLGGMPLAAACGEWDAGLTDTVAPERVVLAGVRDLDSEERELLERSAVTVIGASSVETLVAVKNALDGAPVFVHLDLDVIDPEHFPAELPAPGGLTPDKLYDLAEAVVEDCELVGLEVTAFEAPDDPAEHAAAAETAMKVIEPFLDRLASDRQSKQ
ncbi:MAG: arginase family protein [Thermoleophilaceae bacterium]|nr:arginase family protein [Thermoleophilaceae bacterium]